MNLLKSEQKTTKYSATATNSVETPPQSHVNLFMANYDLVEETLPLTALFSAAVNHFCRNTMLMTATMNSKNSTKNTTQMIRRKSITHPKKQTNKQTPNHILSTLISPCNFL